MSIVKTLLESDISAEALLARPKLELYALVSELCEDYDPTKSIARILSESLIKERQCLSSKEV